MTVESVTYISDLNITLPASGDARSEGDDHIRNLKIADKNTFPNITGAVTPTHTELNYVAGVTSAIQTQLAGKITTGAAGLNLLATVTLTNTATTADFTTLIDSTYEEYELHVINAVPVTDSASPWIRTSANAGGAWDSSGYDYVSTTSNNSIVTATSAGAASSIVLMSSGPSSTASNGGFSAVIRIADPSATASHKRVGWTFSSAANISGNASQVFSGYGSASRTSTSAVSGLRFMFSTGNIASGKFKLYGIKK